MEKPHLRTAQIFEQGLQSGRSYYIYEYILRF